MAGCSDKRYQDLRHAYELNLLSAEERLAFELHLYECDECFDDVRAFRDETLMLRHDRDLKRTVAMAADQHSREEEAPARRRRWPTLVPAFVVAALALIVLVLHPWHIEISPTEEAEAVPDRLAVMYFTNLANPEDTTQLGQIAANLLITDLRQSQYLQVVSDHRVFDVLRSLGQKETAAPSRDVATEVARKTKAHWMIVGTILQENPQLVISAELVDVPSGLTKAAVRVDGEPGQTIFALVDILAARLKSDPSLPTEIRNEPNPHLANVTTNSPQAYRLYLEGVRNFYRFYIADAVANFEQALTFDSSFAMAYYYLASLKDNELIGKALEYADQVTPAEQHYIYSLKAMLAKDYDRAIGEYERVLEYYPDEKCALYGIATLKNFQTKYADAITYLRKVIEIDSSFAPAYNLLTYMYDYTGDFENALLAINKYIELAPDDANPYDSRGDLYSRHGMLDDAIASYTLALQKRADFYASLEKLGIMYLLKQDYAKAESVFALLKSSDNMGQRLWGRYLTATIPAMQGKFNQALQEYGTCCLDSATGGTPPQRYPAIYKATAEIYRLQGRLDLALADFNIYLAAIRKAKPDDRVYDRCMYTQLLTEAGRIKEAEEVVATLKRDAIDDPGGRVTYLYASAMVAQAAKDNDAAVNDLEAAMTLSNTFAIRTKLAEAYLRAGRLSKAVTLFEKLLAGYDMSSEGYVFATRVMLHYYLGLAYEQSLWYDKARDQYEQFVNIWKDADPGIKELEDARARLARLKTKT